MVGQREHIRDLQLLKKKFYQVKVKKAPPTSTEAQAGSSEVRSHPGQYKTFDARVAHFASIVSIMESIPDYKPNEPELSIEGLKAKLSDLKTVMATVAKATNDFTTARIDRDESFYGANGIYSTSKKVKEYVRAVTGVRSQTSRALGKIVFRPKEI